MRQFKLLMNIQLWILYELPFPLSHQTSATLGSSMLVYTLTIYMCIQHISTLQTSYTLVH